MKTITSQFSVMTFALWLFATVGHAEIRDFEDSFGRIIKAQLVSHRSADAETVKMKKADGKEFDVKVSVFSQKDQAFIRKWMKNTPATVSYAFRFEVSKQVRGTSSSSGYDVKITNFSRDTVRDLTIKTRAISQYYRSGYDYIPYAGGTRWGYGNGLVGYQESFDIPSSMKFNQTASFSTEPHSRAEGLFIRIFDAKGQVVDEYKTGGTKIGKLTWDHGKQRAYRSSTSSSRRTGTGGTSRVTID